jgi:hypothetical protein
MLFIEFLLSMAYTFPGALISNIILDSLNYRRKLLLKVQINNSDFNYTSRKCFGCKGS